MSDRTPSAAQDRCECGADPGDINFDRSICACGSMHYFCNQCGAQAEPCSDEPTAAQIPERSFVLRVVLAKLEQIGRGEVPVELEPHEARIILRLIEDERGS